MYNDRLDDDLFDTLIKNAVRENWEKEIGGVPPREELEKLYAFSDRFERRVHAAVRRDRRVRRTRSLAVGVAKAAMVLLMISGAAFGTLMTGEAVRDAVFDTVAQHFESLTKIRWADSNMEAAVRAALAKPEGDIYYYETEGLTELDATEYITGFSGVRSLQDLKYLPNLTSLNVYGNRIEDLTPLQYTPHLTFLVLGDNRIKDITPLTSLKALTFLNIGGNDIADLTPLAGLTNLKQLGLSKNNITDISVIAGLSRLEELYLQTNDIVDLSPVKGLTQLTRINFENNQVTDITPLAGLTNLTEIKAAGNPVKDWSPLDSLKEGVLATGGPSEKR